MGGPLAVEYVALCCACGFRETSTLFRTSSNTSGGGKVEGSDKDKDSCVQKKLCSSETGSAGAAVLGSFLTLGVVSSPVGGVGLLGNGVESATGGFGEDVDARRATRVTRAGVRCGSFLG